jgi:predicted metal-dependent hydrolase
LDRPVIVITGTPAWAGQVKARLSADYHLEHITERTGYVTQLTDWRAAMILVDAVNDEDWRFRVSTPKSSPATRRIPIVVTAEDADSRRAAFTAGADFALRADELIAQIEALAQEYARVEDPARIEQLDCECEDALPPLAVQGIEQFNTGQFYRQHDLFEALWMQTEGPVRDLYRAILQVGVAYYQIGRGNHRGALKMLLRSVQWLLILPDVCQGVDVRTLREDSFRVRAELEAMNPTDIGQFDRSLLKPVRMAQKN